MIKRTNSRSSLISKEKSIAKISKIDPIQISHSFQQSLIQASKQLTQHQFSLIYQKMMKSLINRAETQSPHTQSIFLSTINNCVDIFGGNLQLIVRSLLLQILCELNSSIYDDIRMKLEKVKHMVIHTQMEYLLSKIFLLQQRYYLTQNDEYTAYISLKRCLELNEEHMVQYLQDQEEIRKEIIDHTIIAYFQCFKLKKNQKPMMAFQNLSRALNAAKKNYGIQNKITKSLQSIYTQQENISNNGDKLSSKSRAITEIVEFANKKNYKTSAFYSWQDQKIIVQLLKLKGQQRQIISEACYQIKMDISKIKQLRSSDWISIENGQINILENQLLKLLGVNQLSQTNTKQMTTRNLMKNVSRDDIVKKGQSSDDDEEFFLRQQFKFIKFGKAQSSKKYKQTD